MYVVEPPLFWTVVVKPPSFQKISMFPSFFYSCQASNHEVRIHGYYDVWIDRFLYHDLLISQVVLRFWTQPPPDKSRQGETVFWPSLKGKNAEKRVGKLLAGIVDFHVIQWLSDLLTD